MSINTRSLILFELRRCFVEFLGEMNMLSYIISKATSVSIINKARDPCELGCRAAAGHPTRLCHEAVLIGGDQAPGDDGCRQ